MSLAISAVLPAAVVPRLLQVAALSLAFGLCSGGAFAETPLPDSENGRYVFTPNANGVLRLDGRTGKVSTCRNSGDGWACYGTADERAAFDAETGRLQAEIDQLKKQLDAVKTENDGLKAQLAQRTPDARGKIEDALPKGDKLAQPEITNKDGQRKLEIPLPSDQDVNRVMGFIERAWRRLIEMANRMQKDVSGDGKI